MNSRQGRYGKKFPVVKFAIIGGIIVVIGLVAYMGFLSRTSPLPNFGGKNFSFKVTNTANGVGFVGVGTQGKKSLPVGHTSPTLEVNEGDTVTIHIISEIHGSQKFDFVIPDLGVHSKPIGYFEADEVTFVAYRKGEFNYTSTSHPEMKGLLVVR